jgi:4'-phosphopantetheinyl transferase
MGGATVHYLIENLSNLPQGEGWLSAAEQARAAGFRFAKRRNDWLLGRWSAKRALCAYLALSGGRVRPYSDFEIRSAPDGAPEPFIVGDPAPASLSLSHSGGRAFCAVSSPGTVLGCDLETVRTHDEALVLDYFCEEEIMSVRSAPSGQRDLVTTLIWSAKESALKCLREGLRRDTRSVLVEMPGSRHKGWNPMTVLCRASSCSFSGWWRSDGDYALTIAANGPFVEPAELFPS